MNTLRIEYPTAVLPLLHEIQNVGLFIHPKLLHTVLELAKQTN